MVIPDCVISRWLNSSSSSSSSNRHWLASHDELITFNSDAVVMAVGIARCTQTAVSQPTFVCLTCSSEQYQLSTYPNNTTCFIHCMLLNHCVMTVFSLKKQMNEWMNGFPNVVIWWSTGGSRSLSKLISCFPSGLLTWKILLKKSMHNDFGYLLKGRANIIHTQWYTHWLDCTTSVTGKHYTTSTINWRVSPKVRLWQ